MQSYIFQGNSIKNIDKELIAVISSNYPHITDFQDLLVTNDENKKSIGIDKIKEIQNFLSTKPKSDSIKRVIIKDAHFLTLPAQNSLLKTLEEPPKNTMIFLFTKSKETLLKTIISRCAVISVKNSVEDLNNSVNPLNYLSDDATILDYFYQNSKILESTHNSLEYLNKVEETLKNFRDDKSISLLRNIYKYKERLLLSNVNPRLILEIIYLCR